MSSTKRETLRFRFDGGIVSVDDPSKGPTHTFENGKNVRIEELGSLFTRSGLLNVVANSTASLFMSWYESTGMSTPVISDGTSVYAISNVTGLFVLVGTFPIAGTYFEGQMARGRLYMVNGTARAQRLRWTGSAWEFREVGLARPTDVTTVGGGSGAPGGGGAGTSVTDLTNPTTKDDFLAFSNRAGIAGQVYGFITGAGTAFERYIVATNAAWAADTARPLAMNGHALLQEIPDGRIMYAPEARIILDTIGTGFNETQQRATYFFTPVSGANGAWSGNFPWERASGTRFMWSSGCCIADSVSIGSTRVGGIAFRADGVLAGYSVVEINVAGTEISTLWFDWLPEVSNNGDGTGIANLPNMTASMGIMISATQFLFVYQVLGSTGFRTMIHETTTHAVQINGYTPGVAGSLNGPYSLQRNDRLVLGVAGSNTVFLYRAGTTEVHSYDLGSHVWTLVAGTTETHNSGIVGGQALNQQVYYFGTTNDFKSESFPGAGATGGAGGGGGTGSGGSYAIAVTYVDNLGHESSRSNVTTINGVPSGSAINLTIPVSTVSTVSARRIYSTLSNDPNGDLFFVREVANNTATTVSISSLDSARVLTQVAPDDNDQPEAGHRHITFWNNRVILGNTPGATSRVSYSKTDNADAYPAALIDDVNPEDRGRVQGFIRATYLGIVKSSTTFVLPGDPLEGDPQIRLTDYGCEDERSIVEVAGGGIFLSEKGLVFFDGYNAKRIDKSVSNIVEEFRSATTTSSTGFRELIRFAYEDPASAGNTKVLIYDVHSRGWLIDKYPGLIRAWTFNRESTTLGPTTIAEGIFGLTSANLFQVDMGTTDNGAAITSDVTIRAVVMSDRYHEANWDSVYLDFNSTGAWTNSIVTNVDQGAITTTISDSGATTGRVNGPLQRLPMDHIGRVFRATIAFNRFVRLQEVFVGWRGRERRPK